MTLKTSCSFIIHWTIYPYSDYVLMKNIRDNDLRVDWKLVWYDLSKALSIIGFPDILVVFLVTMQSCASVRCSAGILQVCLLTYILSAPCSCYSSAPTFASWSLWSSYFSTSFLACVLLCPGLTLTLSFKWSFWPEKRITMS